jgi:hypothetical protein
VPERRIESERRYPASEERSASVNPKFFRISHQYDGESRHLKVRPFHYKIYVSSSYHTNGRVSVALR